MNFRDMFREVRRPFQGTLILAILCGSGVAAAAVALLGTSGWFLAGAAQAGAAGATAAFAFNYLLPAVTIRALAIARTLLRYFERYLGHAAALRTLAVLRPRLFGVLTAANPRAVLALRRGEASARLVEDAGLLEGAVVAESAPFVALAGAVAAIALNALLGPGAALICAGGLMATALAGRCLPQIASPPDLAPLKARVFELTAFLPEIAAYDMADAVLARLAQDEARLLTSQSAQAVFEARARIAGLVILALTSALLAATHAHAAMPLLALGLLSLTLGFEALGPWLRRQAQQPLFAAATERLTALSDLPPAAAQAPVGEIRLGDFTIDRATRLWIDGPSGSGKTRLIEQLIGLRPGLATDPARFAWAPQDAAILDGTIRDNLRLAGAVSEAQMHEALGIAQLSGRIAKLGKGLDTWIGEGGVTLSGGERKRLGIARAILRDAPVLVLDEPTEGLDARTEAALVAALAAHLDATDRGLVLVSHRPAPRKLCRERLGVGEDMGLPIFADSHGELTGR